MTALLPTVAKLPLTIDEPGALRALPALQPTLTVLPRGGAHPNFERSGTTTFFLTAPHKPAVHLVGDFNGWDARATPMATDGDGLFWATVALRGPTHYAFSVTMDGSGRRVRVADPYAREIRWDVQGPLAFYADEAPFAWQDGAWRRPALRELVLYELCVRDFAGEKRDGRDRFGTFAGVQAKLDHLADLGISAIELMPVSEFPGDSSWGYNPVFYMAPKWIYGRPRELSALVDAAHQHGIAVIIDMVFNHAWADHPYYRMYPPLFGKKGERLRDLNPFFHHHSNGHANSWGGLDWDHSSPYTTAYMQDVVRHWLLEYRVDGFRFDWLGGVEYDPWQPLREGFDPFCGIAPIAAAARETVPDCYLVGEYWPIHGTNPAKTADRLVRETEIDAVWNGAFHHALENCLFQTWQWECQDMSRLLGGYLAQGFTRADQVVNYLVSHDERRPEHEVQFWGNHVQLAGGEDAARYPTRWEVGLEKARLGLAVLLTSPGVPMLLAGQEFGEDSPRTIEFWPLDWNKLRLPQGGEQYDYCRRLVRLRSEHPALRSDHVEYYWDDFPRTKVLRWKRWDGAGDVVVAAANFDCATQGAGMGFPHDGKWREVITEEVIRVEGHWHDISLAPWRAAIFVPAV